MISEIILVQQWLIHADKANAVETQRFTVSFHENTLYTSHHTIYYIDGAVHQCGNCGALLMELPKSIAFIYTILDI